MHSVVGFEWERHYFDGFSTVAPVVRVLVDGRDLAEVVGEVEMQPAREEGNPRLAGRYAGLWAREELRSSVRRISWVLTVLTSAVEAARLDPAVRPRLCCLGVRAASPVAGR